MCFACSKVRFVLIRMRSIFGEALRASRNDGRTPLGVHVNDRKFVDSSIARRQFWRNAG